MNLPCATHARAPFDALSAQTLTKRFMYRGTSLIRNTPPVGPYSRNMPRALRES